MINFLSETLSVFHVRDTNWPLRVENGLILFKRVMCWQYCPNENDAEASA